MENTFEIVDEFIKSLSPKIGYFNRIILEDYFSDFISNYSNLVQELLTEEWLKKNCDDSYHELEIKNYIFYISYDRILSIYLYDGVWKLCINGLVEENDTYLIDLKTVKDFTDLYSILEHKEFILKT